MKKILIQIFAVLLSVFLGAVAMAGINPGSPGLPSVNFAGTSFTGDNTYYSNTFTNVANNLGSAMCVACHTRNPSARTTAAKKGATMEYIGSHAVTFNFADTYEGGGYQNGKTRTADNAVYMFSSAITPSPINASWRRNPSYGYSPGAGTIAETTDPSTQASQMICESCHSIVTNIGAGKLIAAGGANDNSLLCLGCHGDMDAVLSNEWQLHPVPAGSPAWTGTQHHRNNHSADADTYYKGSATQLATATHNMGIMSRAYYSASGLAVANQMWAANYGTLGFGTNTDGHALSYSANPARLKPTPVDNNQIVPGTNKTASPGGGTVICTNCHRAHNADSSAGATILMRGTMTSPTLGNLPGTSSAANAWQGVLRMRDRGGRDTAINNTNAMCLVCHR